MFFPYISTYILVILFPLMGRYPFHTLFLLLRYSVSQFLNYKLTTRLVENIGFSHPNPLFVLLEITFINFLLFYQNPPQPRVNRTSKYLGIIIGLLHLEWIPSVSIAASSHPPFYRLLIIYSRILVVYFVSQYFRYFSLPYLCVDLLPPSIFLSVCFAILSSSTKSFFFYSFLFFMGF